MLRVAKTNNTHPLRMGVIFTCHNKNIPVLPANVHLKCLFFCFGSKM